MSPLAGLKKLCWMLLLPRLRRGLNDRARSAGSLLAMQPGHDFEAHPAVVVRAFPLIHFEFIVAGYALSRDLRKPLAVFAIHDVLLDELPAPASGRVEVLPTRKLISVQESHHGFRLRPPLLVGV